MISWLKRIDNKLGSIIDAHLALPKMDKPINLHYSKFYPDYFTHKDMRFEYGQITEIFRQFTGTRLNGSLVQQTFAFQVYVKTDPTAQNTRMIDLSVTKFLWINARTFSKSVVCSNWLLDKTGLPGRRSFNY